MDAAQYSSKSNPEDELDKVRDEVIGMLTSDDTDTIEANYQDYVGNFMNTYDPREDDSKSMYNEKVLQTIMTDLEDDNFFLDFIEKLSSEITSLKELFTEEGWDEFVRLSASKMDEDSYEMQDTVITSYKDDEKGLIECWRMVNYSKEDMADIYLAITKKHGGVGVYWAWDEDKAEAYWGESGGHEIMLHGKVSVENVDWKTTLYASAYYLKEEHEIRIKDGGAIMVVGYYDTKIKKYHEFDEPFVVNTGKA